MNDMLGNPIIAEDIVLYDGQVCKVITSTPSTIKYVYGEPWGNRELYIHGTTMNTKVLRLTGFDITAIAEYENKISDAARDFIKPGKRELTIEEQTAKKIERDKRNALKKLVKPFDVITVGSYENLIYFGQFVTAPTNEETGTYHVYAYVGYTRRNVDLVEDILTRTNDRLFSLTYQKSKKQPTAIISSTRNDELKTYFKNIQPLDAANPRNQWTRENYQAIRILLQDV